MADLATSHVRGATEMALLETTIGQAFDTAVENHGDRPALIVCHQNIRWTYKELATEVDRLANGLLALGLEPGERVGIWAPNCWEWVVTQFATAKAGLILVNINPAYRVAELEYALNKVKCAALIAAPTFKSSDYLALMRELVPGLGQGTELPAGRLPHLRHMIWLGDEVRQACHTFSRIQAMGKAQTTDWLSDVGANLDAREIINIQFTSGTTGAPKGASLTHRNILNNGYFVGNRIRLGMDDRLCIPVPLYHCFGMVMGNLACITHGSAMVYAADAFEPESVLQALDKERCTALYGVPTMFIAMLDHPDFNDFDLSSLRTGIMAGSLCPIEVMRRVISQMNMSEVTIAYGMTETSPVSFQSRVDDRVERRVSTVGTIHPHVEVRIVDEAGQTTAPGVQGELLTRGYSVMAGYWDDSERTAEAINQDGWMHTGDLATIDAQGYCKITGRLKDMVIRGGENIYPREVEEYLYRHPDIQDVQVFGVPDVKFGEELVAWIRLHEGAALEAGEVRAFCKGQIAHYKIPHHIRFVAEFPMTVTGKVQKFEMRNTMIVELTEAEDKAL